MKKLALLGNPVKNSISPEIHAEFASQFGIDISYEKILVTKNSELKKYIDSIGDKYYGFNITTPYKLLAADFIRETNHEFKIIGAVNTIALNNNKITGYNTDGLGFMKDLKTNNNFKIEGSNVVILGTGGACIELLSCIYKELPQNIYIVGRDLFDNDYAIGNTKEVFLINNKLNKIVSAFNLNGKNSDIFSVNYSNKKLTDILEQSDIIINATSVGHFGAIPPLPKYIDLGRCFCYDLNYGDASKPFYLWATSNNVKSFKSGIGMLIEQAALSFQHWFKFYPNTKELITTYQDYFYRRS